MRRFRMLQLAAAIGAAAILSTPSNAMQPWEIEPLLQYQAVLRSADDGELVNGETEITFAMFSSPDAPADSPRLWEEGHLLDVSNGLVSVVLGALDPLPQTVFLEEEVWLAVFVGAEELEPRQQLLPVAFALRSNLADHAETAELADNASQLEGRSASEFLGTDGSQTISASSSDSTLQLVQNGSGAALSTTGAIEVNGADVSARSFQYSEPREKEVRIVGAQFHAMSDETVRRVQLDTSVYITSRTGSGSHINRLMAPVILPVGARVTAIRAQFTDNSDSDHLTVNLVYGRDANPGGAIFTGLTVDSDGVSGTGWVSRTLNTPHTIADDRLYALRAIADDDWAAAGIDLRLRSVILTYEIDEVD